MLEDLWYTQQLEDMWYKQQLEDVWYTQQLEDLWYTQQLEDLVAGRYLYTEEFCDLFSCATDALHSRL